MLCISVWMYIYIFIQNIYSSTVPPSESKKRRQWRSSPSNGSSKKRKLYHKKSDVFLHLYAYSRAIPILKGIVRRKQRWVKSGINQ
jgi:hypothetical protein